MDEKIKALKEKYGELIVIEAEHNKMYFRKPKRPEIKRYYDTLPSSLYDAHYTLVLDCVVEPEATELARVFEDKPALAMFIATKLLEQAGLNPNLTVKNL